MFRSRKARGQEGGESQPLHEDMVVIVDRAVNPYLVLFHDPSSFRAEQLRSLRNRLVAMNPDGSSRSLVVTSADANQLLRELDQVLGELAGA